MKRLLTILLTCVSFFAFSQYGQCLLDSKHYHCNKQMQEEFNDLNQQIKQKTTSCYDLDNCEGRNASPQGGNLFSVWDISTIVEYRFIRVGNLVNLNFHFNGVNVFSSTQILTLEMPNVIVTSLVNETGFFKIGGSEEIIKITANRSTNLLILSRLNNTWAVLPNGAIQGNITFEVD